MKESEGRREEGLWAKCDWGDTINGVLESSMRLSSSKLCDHVKVDRRSQKSVPIPGNMKE